jgi:hypothetical protein
MSVVGVVVVVVMMMMVVVMQLLVCFHVSWGGAVDFVGVINCVPRRFNISSLDSQAQKELMVVHSHLMLSHC